MFNSFIVKPLLAIFLLFSILSSEVSLLTSWVSDTPMEMVEKSIESKGSSEGGEKSGKTHLDVDYLITPHQSFIHFFNSDYPSLPFTLPPIHDITLEIPQPPPEQLI